MYDTSYQTVRGHQYTINTAFVAFQTVTEVNLFSKSPECLDSSRPCASENTFYLHCTYARPANDRLQNNFLIESLMGVYL